MGKRDYYLQETEEVLRKLNSDQHGLSVAEVKKRILEYGQNELPEAKRDSYLTIFISQFKSPLIYILLVAGIIVFLMGEKTDAIVIFFVLLFNAMIGTIQEGKAQNTFLALKKFIKGKAVVLRNGEELMISDKDIVPGDIIVLREGEKVPADGRVIVSNSLKLNEAALTGESVPKFKISLASRKKDASIMNRDNMVYKGTVVVAGNGKAIVTETGINTFLGNIAEETLKIDSEFPLKNDIKKLSRVLILFVVVVWLALLVLGLYDGSPAKDIFKMMVVIAVSIIPEGLPIVMTLVLASGVWRMGKKKVLVKKLQAVEVLGGIKVLAVDKTGTVTKNELVIEDLYVGKSFFKVQGNGYEAQGEISLNGKIVDPLNHPELLLAGKIAALNSSANLVFDKKKKIWKIAGDPTEGSLTVFSKKIGFHKDDLISEAPILDEVPFDYELKFHVSLHKQAGHNLLALTGSPETVLSLSENQWTSDGLKKLTAKDRKALHTVLDDMFRKGLRVIGFAFCETKINNLDRKNLPKLVFGGFFGIKDALRAEVRGAVKKVSSAGIKVVMITGDHKIAAKTIAQDAGIYKEKDKILSGNEIAKLTVDALAKKIHKVSVFARITPDQKLKIIKAYQKNGLIVAMTGDGVNDALSLMAADIGIGMGRIGTEVAKEASDIILLDDDFAKITHGVEEGRNIFDTIKKVVLYLFSTSMGEIMLILPMLFLGFPLPILAVQIVWLNLVTDGFLVMALAMGTGEKEKKKKHSYKKTFIVDKLMAQRMFFMATPMVVGTFYLFSQNYQADIVKAWTISLTTLAVFQWFNAWNCRSAEKSIFRMNPFSNKFLVGATVFVILLQMLAVYNPFFQKVLQTTSLDGRDWIIILAVASSIIVVEELRKIFYNKVLSGRKRK